MEYFLEDGADYRYSAVSLETAPEETAVSLATVKGHLNLTRPDHDTWIGNAIVAAERYAEGYTNRQLIQAAYDVYFDRFPQPGGVIELPKPPLAEITSIKYIDDTTGTLTTWDSAEYVVDIVSERGRVWEQDDFSWPTPRIIRHAVVIRMTCGYSDAASVPLEISQALLLLIGHWFSNREAAVGFSVTEIPFGVNALLDHYVSERFF